jgi:hypothetical protein
MTTDQTKVLALMAELQKAETDARFFEVLSSIREMGPEAADIAVDLLPYLGDLNRRYEVRRTLAGMGVKIQRVVEHHLSHCQDDHEIIFTCYVLSDVGTPVSALPTLGELFVTGSESVMYAASRAICAAGPPAVGEFSRILQTCRAEIPAREAVRALGEITGISVYRERSMVSLALEALEAALEREEIREDAAQAILAIDVRLPSQVDMGLVTRARTLLE